MPPHPPHGAANAFWSDSSSRGESTTTEEEAEEEEEDTEADDELPEEDREPLGMLRLE